MSNSVRHAIGLILIAAGGAVAALAKAHPEYQWTGVALAVIGGLVNMFTDAPGTASRMARLTKALGKTTITGCLVMMCGCSFFSTPKGAATEQAGIDLAVCVLNHATEPVSQIVTDCGAAVAEDVVKILDAHRAAMARSK
jgi:hypothetical protein